MAHPGRFALIKAGIREDAVIAYVFILLRAISSRVFVNKQEQALAFVGRVCTVMNGRNKGESL